jgi:hypothetical protein
MYDEVGDDNEASIVRVKNGECEHYKECMADED